MQQRIRKVRNVATWVTMILLVPLLTWGRLGEGILTGVGEGLFLIMSLASLVATLCQFVIWTGMAWFLLWTDLGFGEALREWGKLEAQKELERYL